jgi:excisionase family DNA binding protein
MSNLNKNDVHLIRSALSPSELAVRWGNSRQHIYDLMKQGCLKSFRSGRHHRIPLQEIERFERGDTL